MPAPVPDPAITSAQIRDAVAVANLPSLLLVTYQLTGDATWITAPFLPTRTRGLAEHDSGGLAPGLQEQLRDAAVDALVAWNDGEPPAVARPSVEHLRTMLGVCVGEPVPDDYARMMHVEMGFGDQGGPAREVNSRRPRDVDVLIIGAGASGLLMSLLLREVGINAVIVEKNDHIGGTWYENRYPGAGVDTPSYLYQYSFFPADWSMHFARQDEILTYLDRMAENYDLRKDVNFGHEVTSAIYDEQAQCWIVRCVVRDEHSEREESYSANIVISATGLLNQPLVPEVPGMDTFDGDVFHSARWPEGFSVEGKRVAIVGSGASAMQIGPSIAAEVESLSVFQRTPQWVAPVEQVFQSIGPEIHWLMNHVPYYRDWYRFRQAWIYNDKNHDALQKDPLWAHPERSVSAHNDKHREYFTNYTRKKLDGRPDLQEKCVPSYPPFEKRILLDYGWYDMLTRDNVELLAEGVASIRGGHVVGTSGESREVDVIVMCTGFRAQTPLFPIDVRGRAGVSIRDRWGNDDPSAYLGTVVPGFPNFFMIRGPNTTPGGGSSIFITECQARYIRRLVTEMADRDLGEIDVRTKVHDQYNVEVQDAHSKMVWTHPGTTTYYRNSQGRVVVNMPWRVVDYWRLLNEAGMDDFDTREKV